MKGKLIKRLIVIPLIIIITGLLFAGRTFAAGYNESLFNSEVPKNITYIMVSEKEMGGSDYTLKVPYSDEFFEMPSDKFSLTMARSSLGMAIAAMREWRVEDDMGYRIKDFFNEAGFEDIEASEYKNIPTEDSICYAIANKKINDYTVLCIAVCGGGYKKEWASNLLVGDGERHQGFNEAAMKVEKAIEDYKQVNNISGKIKIWINGFSRSAAVSNLVAGDLIESGKYDDLYAYCFATPRVTQKPVAYKNIFNIIGKNDVVPKIPFADWGYQRNGIELYTKGQEMDSDYAYSYFLLNLFASSNGMLKYLNNPEINYLFRTVFDYLYKLMPTATEYKTRLQDTVLGVMKDASSENILVSIVDVMEKFAPDDKDETEELSELLDYMELIINQYVFQGNTKQIDNGQWNPDIDVTTNLMGEHAEARYAKWLFCSDDVNDIFSPNTDYMIVTIEGECVVDIFDKLGFLETIEEDGREELEYPEERFGTNELTRDVLDLKLYPVLDVQAQHGKKVITLPRDNDWRLIVTGKTDQDWGLSYVVLGFSGSSSVAQTSKYYIGDMKKDDSQIIYLNGTGTELVDEEKSYFKVRSELFSGLYSPSLVMRIDRLDFQYLTIGGIFGILALLGVIVALDVIISIILGIVRIVRKKKRRPGATIVFHCINAAIFTAVELAIWAFIPAIPIVRYVAMGIVCLIIIGLALKAMENKPKKKWRIILLCIVGTLMLAHVLVEIFVLKTVVNLEWLEPVIAYTVMIVLCCIIFNRSPEEIEMQKQMEANLKIKAIEKKKTKKIDRLTKKGEKLEEKGPEKSEKLKETQEKIEKTKEELEAKKEKIKKENNLDELDNSEKLQSEADSKRD